MEFTAVIPAGGIGSRSGLSLPKQFFRINGKELIAYTIEVFQNNDMIKNIIVAAPEDYFPLLEDCKIKYGLSKISLIVKGGEQRQDSVYNALVSGNFSNNDFIAVHDAARPLLSGELLTRVLEFAAKTGNAVLALKARDTLASGGAFIESYTRREQIHYIQTPQVFRYSDLRRAFDKAYEENFYGSDESMLVHRTGIKVNLIEGSYINFKITTPEDIELFNKLI
jgi:2-C-methyl-D-erythritol 4-phosphate cytidylyltransferase